MRLTGPLTGSWEAATTPKDPSMSLHDRFLVGGYLCMQSKSLANTHSELQVTTAACQFWRTLISPRALITPSFILPVGSLSYISLKNGHFGLKDLITAKRDVESHFQGCW